MRIVNLIENTEGKTGCLYEHGLSFYIETEKHKILMDTGASDAYIANAPKLGIDLKQVDAVVLSHGHYDHTGGVMAFSKINDSAKIYMQSVAKEEYYHKSEDVERYIGIDRDILTLPNLKPIDGNDKIDEGIEIFTGVTERRLWPTGNKVLKVKKDDEFYQDEFLHEQYLVIQENGKSILISGCAHNGILNILDKYREIYEKNPDIVISGFHMMKKSGYTDEDLRIVKDIAEELKKTDIKFYTGHCTGEEPYRILKECMGEQIEYVHSGDEINI